MGAKTLGYAVCCVICLFLAAGSSVPEKHHKAISKAKKRGTINTQIHVLEPDFSNQLDIPIINPTTPTTTPTNPYVTPTYPYVTPTYSTPPPPATNFNPVTPTPTTPITTPTTPITTPTTPTPSTSTGAWCIASSSASETTLQVALDYACGYGGADCSAIQPGGSCYNPNTLKDHASYAFNSYYQKLPSPTSCVFGGAAQLTYTDPSTGSCRFPQSSSSSTIPSIASPPPPTTVTPYTPVTPTTPTYVPTTPTVTTPNTDYEGEEPVGNPSSTTSVSSNILILLATACITMWHIEVNFN